MLKIEQKSLIHFYNKIKKEYDKINISVDNIDYCKTDDMNINEKYGRDRFFPKPILEDVNQNLIHCFLLNYYNTHIHIYTKYNIKQINGNKNGILKIIKNICKIIFITRRLFADENELTIHYFDCEIEKRFPEKKGIVLSEENCNSGSSYVGSYLMFVYRREEYIRVLIHELIHSFMGDYSLINDNFNLALSKVFCLNNDDNININETYTESLATIINLIFHYLELDREKKDKKKRDFKKLEKMLQIEFEHSVLACVTILDHYDYKSIKQLRRDDNNCKTLLQKTSVFNYYILKPFMLYNLDGLYKLIKKCSKNLQFSKMEICLDEFFNLIVDNFDNKKVQGVIDRMLKNKKYRTKSLAMVKFR